MGAEASRFPSRGAVEWEGKSSSEMEQLDNAGPVSELTESTDLGRNSFQSS